VSIQTLPRIDKPGTDDDDWTHLFCDCDPDVALCGADLAGVDEVDYDEPDADECPLCVVIADVAGDVCARCGK
jgi:hypothetical protein